MENALVNLKNQCEDFEVEFEVLPAIDITQYQDKRRLMIQEGLSDVEDQLAAVQAKIEEYNTEIDRLTNQADGLDYTIAVACGILTGMIDAFWVGELDIQDANTIGENKINDFVVKIAQSQGYEGEDLAGAVAYLEQKFPLAADAATAAFGGGTQHHLRDFSHHPTPLGLFFSLLTQFTECFYGTDTSGKFKVVSINDLSEHDKALARARIGKDVPQKIIYGTIYWFFHLVSDMAGASGSISKGKLGTGLPGPLVSLLKEISSLPFFKKMNKSRNREFLVWISKLFNGTLWEKRDADGKLIKTPFDLRTEIGMAGKQAIPVVINECMVRSFYFIRRLYLELKEHPVADIQDLKNICWEKTWPIRNRTIVRMMTIASGTFTAVDMADAAIHAAGKSGGTVAGFAAQMVLRVNFVGVGRFAVAVATDAGMGVKRSMVRNKRIELYTQQLALTNAKVFYKEADMWISAQDAGKSIEEACAMAEKATAFYWECMQDISDSLEHTGEYISEIGENNPDLLEKMKDILEWG